MTRSIAILLICATATAAPRPKPPLSLPKEVAGEVGEFVRIKARTTGTVVQWASMDDGLSLIPAGELRDSRVMIVSARKAGEFKVVAFTSIDNTPVPPAYCTVKITGGNDYSEQIRELQAEVVELKKAAVAKVAELEKTIEDRDSRIGYLQTATETLEKTAASLRQSVADRDGEISRLKAELERLQPRPPPIPDVVTSPTLWIVTIDRWAARTPAISSVLLDVPLWQGFKAAGHQYEQVDSSNAAIMARFKAQVDANGGLPIVILMAPDGTVLNKGPGEMRFPANSAALKALVAKYAR